MQMFVSLINTLTHSPTAHQADLKKLEEVYRTQDLYVWLAYRMPRHSFPGLAEVMSSRERCAELIEQGLEDLSTSESNIFGSGADRLSDSHDGKQRGGGQFRMGRHRGKHKGGRYHLYDEEEGADDEDDIRGGRSEWGGAHQSVSRAHSQQDEYSQQTAYSSRGGGPHGVNGTKGKAGKRKRRKMFDQDEDESESWAFGGGGEKMADGWFQHHQAQRASGKGGEALWHCRNEPIPGSPA